jgi:hypothetical protein
MLLFFSSGLRPGYMRNVLDCLCYPPGHVIHFRYRNGLIEFDSTTERNVVSAECSKAFGVTDGLIVYADSTDFPEGEKYDPDDPVYDFTFFPVRFVEALPPIEHGNWSYIPLVLGPYPRYAYVGTKPVDHADFNNAILSMEDRPRRMGHSAGEGRFVKRVDLNVEAMVLKADPQDLHDAWEATVTEIGETSRFKDKALFYRLDHLFEAKEDWPRLIDEKPAYQLKKIEPVYHSELVQCIYSVRADVDFRLRVITHQGKNLLPHGPSINLVADPAIFTGETNGRLFVDSPYNEESLFLRSKRATESALTAIELGAKGGPETMLAARPRFLIKVDPLFTQYLLWIAVVLALGQLLLAVNQDILNLLNIGNPIWIAVGKVLGFFLTLVGVGLAFRKMKIP